MGVSDNTDYQVLIAFLSVIGILGCFLILWIWFIWWMKRYRRRYKSSEISSHDLNINNEANHENMWNKPRRILTYRFDESQKGIDGVITFTVLLKK